jgi:prophage regulatory protein
VLYLPLFPEEPGTLNGANVAYTEYTSSTILRRKQVERETGYSRSTIYLRISQRLWPKPVSLGARAVGWPASEIQAMNAARIAGRSDDEIRELVGRLEQSRGSPA